MNFFIKTTIASMAIAGMVHADTMLIGVDAGLTIGGKRLGVVAGITGGDARSYHAVGKSATCGSAVVAVQTTPCSYVKGPCTVIAPPCDPCKR